MLGERVVEQRHGARLLHGRVAARHDLHAAPRIACRPMTVTGPPNRRPRTPCRVKPASVKLRRPPACSIGGSSSSTLTRLAANSYSPAALVWVRSASGRSSFRCSLPRPSRLHRRRRSCRLSRCSGEALDVLEELGGGAVGLPAHQHRRRARLEARHAARARPQAARRARCRCAPAICMRSRSKRSSPSMSSMRGQPSAYCSTPLLDPGGDLELAAGRIGERKLAQVAAQAHAHVARMTPRRMPSQASRAPLAP